MELQKALTERCTKGEICMRIRRLGNTRPSPLQFAEPFGNLGMRLSSSMPEQVFYRIQFCYEESKVMVKEPQQHRVGPFVTGISP